MTDEFTVIDAGADDGLIERASVALDIVHERVGEKISSIENKIQQIRRVIDLQREASARQIETYVKLADDAERVIDDLDEKIDGFAEFLLKIARQANS